MAASREDWERTGRMLAERRVQLNARYANRTLFAEETGLNWRTLHDAELGKRSTFKADTLRAFEVAYRLVPGSLDRTLAGDPLEPEPPRRRPEDLFAEDSDSDEAAILFPDDRTLRTIWRLPEPEETRLDLIRQLRRKRMEREGGIDSRELGTA